MKPIILITHKPLPEESLGIRESYCRAIVRSGGIPVISALGAAKDYARICQGVVFTGSGCDIHPRRYGQSLRGSLDCDDTLDETELRLFREFRSLGKPILGICRGHQLINVALGGTLLQDLSTELTRDHRSPAPGTPAFHRVQCAPGSLMAELFGRELTVNSYHHQAVDVPGDGLIPTALSGDGVIEALEHIREPIFGVQFHPERMLPPDQPQCPDMGPLFTRFVSLCPKDNR